MADETDATEANDPAQESPDLDDSRFEVKWRKKESSASSPDRLVEPGGDSADTGDLQRQLDEERERVKDLQERWQRAQADLANLRKRTEQERSDLEKMASMFLVQEILPVLDNFERALNSIPGNLSMLTWIQGVMLIERHLSAILAHQGLEAIEALGKEFDARFHEAVSERETDEGSPGTVLQEYQKGYMMHGRVIRPSLVEVAGKPSESSPEAEETQPDQEPDYDAPGEEIAEEAEIENVGP